MLKCFCSLFLYAFHSCDGLTFDFVPYPPLCYAPTTWIPSVEPTTTPAFTPMPPVAGAPVVVTSLLLVFAATASALFL